jgi:hypothetical protein
LEQHLETLSSDPDKYRPTRCPTCGLGGLWCHGHYERKADRTGELNPIPVPRYRCGKEKGCGKTCSSLPSCIAPRRWYLWLVHQLVLLCLLAGESLESCATKFANLGPAVSTMQRWWRWLKARHLEFSFHLRGLQPEWGRATQWREFWRRAIDEKPLRELMAYLAHQGLIVP